jgi:hypothetical protein
LKHVGEWNLHDVQVGKVDVVNPRTGYRFSIDHMKISGMKFRRGELLDSGEWSIASDFLTVTTEASRLWPHSDAARRIVGTIHKDFFRDLKADFGLVVEIAGGESPLQYHAECADGKMVLDENGHRTMIEYNDYSVDDYFQTPRQIPLRHVTFRASRPTPPQKESAFWIESRGSFQLGETEFEIPAGAFEPQDRTLVGTAERDGKSYQARMITHSAALTRPVIQLTVGDQPATVDEWAAIVFHRPVDELRSSEVELLEDAIARSAEDAEDDEAIEVEVEEEGIKAEREPGDAEQ